MTMNDNQSRGRRAKLERFVSKDIVTYIVLYSLGLLFLVPYLWMLSTSLKPPQLVFSQIPHWIPDTISLQWYSAVLAESQIVRWTFNTFLVAGSTTVVVVVFDSLVAYSLTKLNWFGKRFLTLVIIASFLVPTQVNIVPLYTVISQIGLVNNPLGMILPLSAAPLGIFLLIQFFEDVPDKTIEAARLDGFSSFRIYWKIVLPMMRPALAALSLYTFITTWNQFLWPLVVFQDSTWFTLPIGIVTMQPTNVFQPGAQMAGALIASLPLFVLFLVLQNQLVTAVQAQGTVE